MKYIVGNWKMYPRSLAEAKEIVAEVKAIARKAVMKKVQPVICPPSVFLAGLMGSGSSLQFGGQNAAAIGEGPFTGEVSPVQLASLGAKYVILGHSERRALGESDADVAAKAIAAVKAGLMVILCVGEKERDHDGHYFVEVANQLRGSLANFPESKSVQLMIAYEPIWAIGVNATHPATPRDHQEMSMLLRRTLAELFGKQKGFHIPLLYGGSVDAKNAQSFLDIGADGLLVGRTSLRAKDFALIIHNAVQNNA
ncbi:MAG TPA: triose-phosphate isomerase [Candidatus Paceibacterota bacterium]|nr:triose-phosphate isomerase [Candidatus Paceibacterota bacterium]